MQQLAAFLVSHTVEGVMSADRFAETYLRHTGQLVSVSNKSTVIAMMAELGLAFSDKVSCAIGGSMPVHPVLG